MIKINFIQASLYSIYIGRNYTQSFIYIKTYRIVSKTNLNMSYNKKILLRNFVDIKLRVKGNS